MHIWLQEDKSRYGDTMNMYEMEEGNPVNGLDPSGQGQYTTPSGQGQYTTEIDPTFVAGHTPTGEPIYPEVIDSNTPGAVNPPSGNYYYYNNEDQTFEMAPSPFAQGGTAAREAQIRSKYHGRNGPHSDLADIGVEFDKAIDSWASDQKKKVEAALIALAGGNRTVNQVDAGIQAKALASAAVDIIANTRKLYGDEPDIGLLNNYFGNYGCGDWQVMMDYALVAANNKFRGKNQCPIFQINQMFASKNPGLHTYTHNWVTVSLHANKNSLLAPHVTIDPYATGGNGDIVNTSQSSNWISSAISPSWDDQ
jgi:hypothetical protein